MTTLAIALGIGLLGLVAVLAFAAPSFGRTNVATKPAIGQQGPITQFLPLLYLLGGTLSWAVTLGRTPKPYSDWQRGLYGLLASFPMMLVGLVWLFAGEVLYAPYVGPSACGT